MSWQQLRLPSRVLQWCSYLYRSESSDQRIYPPHWGVMAHGTARLFGIAPYFMLNRSHAAARLHAPAACVAPYLRAAAPVGPAPNQ